MEDRYVKSNENKKVLYMDASNLYGHSMPQSLPFVAIEMWHGHPDLYMKKLGEIKNTPDDSDTGYFVDVDLRCPDKTKEKTKKFPFCLENKVIPIDKFNEYLKELKPKKYTKAKKLTCDWTDKRN